MAKRKCTHRWCDVTTVDVGMLTCIQWPDPRVTAFSVRCCDCGAELSLGESNDDPVAVQVEISAAELEPIWGLKLMSILIERSQGEIDGGDCHSMHVLGETRGGDYPVTLDAGWLAREMATHEQREDRDRDADAWPWDPARPVAGQYEEWLVARAAHDRRGRHEDSLNARTTELDVIAGPEPETGVEVPLETGHTCSDRSLDCAACDVADDAQEDLVKKVTIEVLRCYYGHDVQCITINDLRIAGGKCCGQWKAVRRWEVDESSLLQDLKRARIEIGAATSADAQAWHCGTEIAANQLLKRVEELEDAIAEQLAARGDGAQGFGRLRQLMASAEPRSS